jgi:hypothetical protein
MGKDGEYGLFISTFTSINGKQEHMQYGGPQAI